MSDQMRLRWTSHQGTILSVLDALLTSESLVDVTLACDGQYIRAHKLILSACSPYFQELLNVEVNKHPIFFLNNVKYTDLQALIQYMYRGEVNISREDLPSLLQVAQVLKIRGLADVETSTSRTSSGMLILPDLGNASRQYPPPLVTSHPPHPPPTSVASTPNAYSPLNFQPHSLAPPSVKSTVASPIIAAAPSFAPPLAKKTRMTETITRPSVQVQNQSQLQLGDAHIVVHRLPPQIDPLQSALEPNFPNFEETENENQEIKEQQEFYEGVKVEEIEHLQVNLTEEYDEENSMSQSEPWQLGEGDTTEMTGDDNDDGGVPGGSCGNNETEGGEGLLRSLGLTRRDKPFASKSRIFDGRFFKMISWKRLMDGRSGKRRKEVTVGCISCGRTLKSVNCANFLKHLECRHPLLYRQFQEDKVK